MAVSHERRYEVRYPGQTFGFAWFNSEADAELFREAITSSDEGIAYVVFDTAPDARG